jgi:adenylylsulfate kinase
MSWAIWITGVPGSGKSAIARAAAAALAARGEWVQILELDALRRTLTPAPAYDDEERQAVYRALVVIARALTCAGRPVLIDATAHRREWRDLARASIADFAEVQLECPLEVARERERTRPPGHHPRAIYARAGRPGATVPGVDVPYEPAVAPELTIDTTRETVDGAGARVAALAGRLARAPSPPPVTDGWVLWVTGRPGSGKTTIVCGACERLRRQGVPAVVLDVAEFVRAVAPGGEPSRRQADIATRALVLAARLLSEAGVAAVIDGPPLRDGIRLAREIVAEFAAVELVCPAELGRARERAVRWGLVACPGASRPAVAPSLGLEYERAVAPDLVLDTEALDPWTTIDEVMRLVQRLAGAARSARHPAGARQPH